MMQTILYNFVMLITKIHDYILGISMEYNSSLTDKELHFLVIGIFGIALVLMIHPVFHFLAEHGHTMVVTFLYVLTVVLVITFAIEIGQGYYGTGAVELDDVIYGVAGFLAFFFAFSVIRGIVHMIMNAFRKDEEDDPEWLK